MSQIRVGFSGWTFPGWKEDFYPKGLSSKDELQFASRKVNPIEINGTFYALQKPATFQHWYDQTPRDFCFSVKAGQFITHVLRLKEVNEPLANFFASGLLCLREKLGPILWQFPPNVMLKDDRFEKFLKLLPHDSRAAEKLARRHGSKVKGRAWTDAGGDYPVRHAFEFRHPSFKNPYFIEMLLAHNVAVVFGDSGKKSSPYMEDLTADFVYARMHGQDKRYSKGYTKSAIERWAKRIETWAAGKQPKDAELVSSEKPRAIKRDIFIYFDTEVKEYAPYDAMNLLKRLKLKIDDQEKLAA